MSLISGIFLFIGAILAFIFHKTSTTKVNTDNSNTLQEVKDLQQKVDTNNVDIQNEESKRLQLEKDAEIEKAKVAQDSINSDAQFYIDHPTKPKS